MAIPEGDKQRVAYWQTRLRELDTETARIKVQVASETGRRKAVAYSLKALAIFGGLAIATGFLPALAAQIVAVAIAAAVAADQWLSNYARMLAVDEANKALRATIAAVRHRHTMELDPILKMNGQGDAATADKLAEMIRNVYNFEFKQKEEIVKALEAADTAALKRLTLEAEAAKK